MKINYFRPIQAFIILALSISIGLLMPSSVHAEGSRNLMENGGFRAWLQYSGDGTTTAGILRDNELKVYVNEGETLYLGSSAIGIGVGDIRWTAPDGAAGVCSVQGAGVGRIQNRAQEVAGPAPLTAGGYTPCTLTVGSGQTGIWLVTFTAPQIGGGNPRSIEADAAWTQSATISAVAAWDITVVGTDNLEKIGRAYASYLPLTLANFERSLNSELFVLTKDGYQYRWNLNGIQPTTFILFSNKKGFKLAATDQPSYESVMLTGGEVNNLLPAGYELNAPDDPDMGTDVTNKTFFNIPSPDLPLTATRPTTVTWLLRDPMPPIDISDLTYTAAPSASGGTLTFNATTEGRYQLFIDTNNDGIFGFEHDVVLVGDATAGANTALWDGLDHEGNVVESSVCYQVFAQGMAGEVHFPIYDAEQNPNGLIIERLNGPNPGNYTVYYNDMAIGGAQAIAGEMSENGAHAWTVVPGGDPDGFGNQRGIDSWTYAISDNTDSVLACEQANLVATKRDSLAIDVDNNGIASPGDTLQYEIVIQNTGASTATNVIFNDTPDANTTLVAGTVDAEQGTVLTGNSVGDTSVRVEIGSIPGNGSVTIRFDVTINNPLPEGVTQVENQGFVSSAEQPVVPTDDPDTVEPDDPTRTPVVAAPILDAFKTDVFAIDQDGDGNVSPGDRLEYQIMIANSGNTAATNVIFADTLGQYTELVSGTVQTSQGTIELVDDNDNTEIRVTIGSIPAGGSVNISFRVDIHATIPPNVKQVENQGLITSSQGPTVPTDDPDTPVVDDPTITPVSTQPLIDAFKQDNLIIDADSDGFASPGDTLVYDISIHNNGNTAATSVAFNDVPDINTALVVGSVRTDQGTVTAGNNPGDTSITINIGEIASGGVVNVSFRVVVNSPLPEGVTQVENQGFVSGVELAIVFTDDPDTPAFDDPTITPVVAAPILDAFKTDLFVNGQAFEGNVNPGDRLTYEFILVNLGNAAATNVIFDDMPGLYTTLVSGSVQSSQGTVEIGNGALDTSVRINIGVVPVDGSVTFRFDVEIDDTLPANVNQVENQGFVNSGELPTVLTDDPDTPVLDDPTVTPVGAMPAIDAFKRDWLIIDADGNGFASPGDTLVYDITILNNGNTAATNVSFTDAPDANTTLVAGSVRTEQGVVTLGNGAADTSIAIEIGEIASGAVVNVSFRVTINAPLPTTVKQVVNQGIITGENIPEVPTDDPDTPLVDDKTTTPVVAEPILMISKRDVLFTDANGDGIAGPGDILSYQIVLLNSGNAAAEDVVLTDTPDVNTTLVPNSVRTDQGTVTQGNAVGDSAIAIDIGNIPPSSAVNISFQVTINDPLPAGVIRVENQAIISTISITATIPSDDPDTPEVNDSTKSPVAVTSLSTLKSSDPASGSQLNPGETITYRVTVTNTGSITLTGIVIRDTIPAGTSYVPNSAAPAASGPDPLVWSIPTLGVGQSSTVSFMVRLDPAPVVTSVRNVALVSSEGTPEAPSNETVHFVIEPTALEEVDEPTGQSNVQIFVPLISQ